MTGQRVYAEAPTRPREAKIQTIHAGMKKNNRQVTEIRAVQT
jgi:hypothetical protein